ncbi:polyamine-modulated factor 1-binding protein 1 isoform x1 [Limosa lapponica baueri]|uniref:Polyamine-modulated factor 1-binding protein 1 isoform x1 n=1 Tax=Limosa lapponica baueri TaxID=1758121 RepID=A0A2I0TVF3_LIMLA|nr:polyamine-modulated factor 1-binding protein 1 isoform x1 [Limosa lapponica baueri]
MVSLGLRKDCHLLDDLGKERGFTMYVLSQELASQDEKLLLMESSLKATQEQQSEQIAETVRQEQNSRKSQTELKTLREHIVASEEEISDCKFVASIKDSLSKSPLTVGLVHCPTYKKGVIRKQ